MEQMQQFQGVRLTPRLRRGCAYTRAACLAPPPNSTAKQVSPTHMIPNRCCCWAFLRGRQGSISPPWICSRKPSRNVPRPAHSLELGFGVSWRGRQRPGGRILRCGADIRSELAAGMALSGRDRDELLAGRASSLRLRADDASPRRGGPRCFRTGPTALRQRASRRDRPSLSSSSALWFAHLRRPGVGWQSAAER